SPRGGRRERPYHQVANGCRRSVRTRAIRQGSRRRWHLRTRAFRIARGTQDWPLDVVHLPADRWARTERDVTQVRDFVTRRSRRLSPAPVARAAIDRVLTRPRGVARTERNPDPRAGGRDQAAVVHDA